MPTPPIDNPTPFTCANCGAGLQARAEFCPHCGARMEVPEIKAARSAGWIVGTLALGILTLAFGGLGACSAYMSASSVSASSAQHLGGVVLTIAIPLLIVGGIGALLCGRALLRRLRQ